MMFTFNGDFSEQLEVEEVGGAIHSQTFIHSPWSSISIDQLPALFISWSICAGSVKLNSSFVHFLIHLEMDGVMKICCEMHERKGWGWITGGKCLAGLFKISWNRDLMRVLELVPLIIIAQKYYKLIFMLMLPYNTLMLTFLALCTLLKYVSFGPTKPQKTWNKCSSYWLRCADGQFPLKIQSLIAY